MATLNSFENPLDTQAFITEARAMATQIKARRIDADDNYTEVLREITGKLSSKIRDEFYKYHHQNSNRPVEQRGADTVPALLDSLVKYLSEGEGAAALRRFVEGPSRQIDSTREDRHGTKRSMPQRGDDFKRPRFGERTSIEARRKPPDWVTEALEKKHCTICRSTTHRTIECNEYPPDERHRILKNNQVCMKCGDHRFNPAKQCTNTDKCSACGSPRHSRLVCKIARTAQATVTLAQRPQTRVCLSAIRAKLVSGKSSIAVNVMFDSAAQTSLVTTETVARCGGTVVPSDPILLVGVTDGYRRTDELLPFKLVAWDDSNEMDMWAYTSPHITSQRIRPPSTSICERARLRGIAIQPGLHKIEQVDVLIGQDVLWAFLTPDMISLGPLIGAIRTTLGWYIAGNEGNHMNERNDTSNNLNCHICQDLSSIFEITEDASEPFDWESVKKQIENHPDQCRYTTRLPKRSLIGLGDNYHNARCQAFSLKHKLLKSGEYEEYDGVISEYLSKEFAERAPQQAVGPGMYTIPHHLVRKAGTNKTPARVVFNASSAVKGKRSLNQCLSKGQSLNSDIWSVLIRFRLAPIIILTDLVKAFSQIKVHPKDRDLQRYLWFETKESQEPTTYRMSTVIFGATCSPYLLGAVLEVHADKFKNEFPELVAQIKRALYLDDAALTARTPQEAIQLMDQAEGFFMKASFQLHPWVTNEPSLTKTKHPIANMDEKHKCLGLIWEPKTDNVSIKPPPDSPSKLTRRTTVSILSKLYDPLGWFAPMKTRIRLFIRDLANTTTDWDETITPSDHVHLKHLLGEVQAITRHSIPRTMRFDGGQSLHVFCDGSPQAYAAAAYLVGPRPGERMLICARVKLAPKKLNPIRHASLTNSRNQKKIDATVPRLELLAASLGAQLCEDLMPLLPEGTPVALHSDSEITIKRIRGNPNRQDNFEMRRLCMILERSTPDHWHHVRSKDNPADFPTKNTPTKTWIDSTLWWQGPSNELHSLAKPMPTHLRSCFVTQTMPSQPEVQAALNEGYDKAREHFLAEVKAQTLMDPARMDRVNEGKTRKLSIEQYACSNMWRAVQYELFTEDIDRLRTGLVPSSKSRLRLLRPFLDEWGLLRSRRLAQSPELDWEGRHPILLASHPVVRGFIRSEHERLFHNGMRDFRNQFGIYYHVLKGRQVIRSVIGTCVRCNLFKGKPFAPMEPALPTFRVEPTTQPFTNIGLDYCGPIKTSGKTRVYILIATCAVTRAIHLEMTTSLSAKHCLLALERLFARRGVPREIHSDNATTFKATNRTLAAMVKRIQMVAAQHPEFNIEWHFQAPRAPWWGGFFERLVQCVKNALRHTYLRRMFDSEEVNTLLCQIEAVINSRPLVECADDGLPALTPSHFLVGHALTGIPPFPGRASTDSTFDEVLKNYLAYRATQNGFWNRFRKEYLLTLQHHHRQREPSREPRTGEMVVVTGEENASKDRFSWPLARIERTIPGADRVIRTAEISIGGRRFIRPIQRLIPLEATQARSAPGPGEDVMTQVDKLIREQRQRTTDKKTPLASDE